jgi:hypothetical protein
MGAPLSDITIYYDGDIIKDAPIDWDFRKTVNYIADFYHDKLEGYKPSKTSRICIFLGPTKNRLEPSYFGTICSYDNIINETKYLNLSKNEKYKYILDLLHSTILEIANFYAWDKAIFNIAYNQIISLDFKFEKHFSEKKSKDGKGVGQIILTKTEENSTLNVLIKKGEITKYGILIEKRNSFWYDSFYSLAKKCKWLDHDSFGLVKNGKNCYFSFDLSRTINDVEIGPYIF